MLHHRNAKFHHAFFFFIGRSFNITQPGSMKTDNALAVHNINKLYWATAKYTQINTSVLKVSYF